MELWNRVSFLAGTPQVEMLTTPFLTDLDTRAAVKGSRDPLGIQSIWTRFGRHVVGNLTTVSDSIRDFTTLLLGYHFAESLADETDSGSELAVFCAGSNWRHTRAPRSTRRGDSAARNGCGRI
jgi:hypothetical protein